MHYKINRPIIFFGVFGLISLINNLAASQLEFRPQLLSIKFHNSRPLIIKYTSKKRIKNKIKAMDLFIQTCTEDSQDYCFTLNMGTDLLKLENSNELFDVWKEEDIASISIDDQGIIYKGTQRIEKTNVDYKKLFAKLKQTYELIGKLDTAIKNNTIKRYLPYFNVSNKKPAQPLTIRDQKELPKQTSSVWQSLKWWLAGVSAATLGTLGAWWYSRR